MAFKYLLPVVDRKDLYVCDLSNLSEVGRLVGLVKPDLIIHCASFVPSILSDYDDAESSKINLLMLKNIAANS